MQTYEIIKENIKTVRDIERNLKPGEKIQFEKKSNVFIHSKPGDFPDPEGEFFSVEEALIHFDFLSRRSISVTDNKEIDANAENILESVTKISKTISQANRERMLAVIAEIFKLDVVSESDILKTILEHGELRKLLSKLLGNLGVETSFTQATTSLQVTTGKIKFSEYAEYNLEDYKKGVTQAAPVINEFKVSKETIDTKESEIQSKDRIISSQERKIQELSSQIELLNNQDKNSRNIKPIIPVYYFVMFNEGSGPRFITVEKGAKSNEDGSYPTKYLGKTSFVSKAKKFSNSEGLAQIAKIIRNNQNVTFAKLEGKGPKELLNMFKVVRVLIEIPETVE